jgi:hypothetical protein
MELYLPRWQTVRVQLWNSRQGKALTIYLGTIPVLPGRNTGRKLPKEFRNILLLLDRDDSLQ